MLRVQNLYAEYPHAQLGHVLEDVSFMANSGERIALLGANGAGKSTLLLALLGVLPPGHTAGSIEVCGIKLEKATLTHVRARAGLVFQNPDDQLFMSTVWEDVLFGPLNYGRDKTTGTTIETAHGGISLEEKARFLLDSLGIGHLKDRMSHKLSGGEKRLAALASVLIMEPQVLLLDEPTAFLDPRGKRALTTILASLPQTMLIATHDIPFVEALASRAIVLCKGVIRADGPTGTILRDKTLLEESGL
ncbi:MAG: energy-coupling factor ABC transporter ATP-binding protein [Spirochaetaceae bacterium]|jgi:cobalt/nickel transport system ATP-binding protein|nr:energy-coupling factor ABC transporter ATP-binding protein [Spirochaetaceae bacterium]